MILGFVLAIGAAVTWGLVYALSEKLLHSTSPATLVFFESAIAAIIILPFALGGEGSIKSVLASSKGNLALIIGMSVLVTVADLLIFASIKHLNASTAAVIEIAYPFFVVIFSFILFRAVPNLFFLLGGSLIFAGAVIIMKYA